MSVGVLSKILPSPGIGMPFISALYNSQKHSLGQFY